MDKAKFITLDNGLTILIYVDNSKSTNHMELFTFFGSNHTKYIDYNGIEKEIKKGSAHLLEHYVCENAIYGNLLDKLLNKGVFNCNAITYKNRTSYYFNTVTNFYECLELFLNGIYNVRFSKNKLDKTKKAIFSEIRDDEDNVNRKINYEMLSGLFSINEETLGSKDSVNSITISEVKSIYESIFVPCNQFLVLTGNFDYDKTLKMVKDFYNNKIFKCNNKLDNIIDKRGIFKKKIVYECDLMDKVIISFKIDIDNLSDFDRYKLDWYINFFLDINFSRYSKINEYISNSNDYIDNISNCSYYFNGYLVIEIAAFTNKVKDFEDKVLSIIKNRDNEEKSIFELVLKDTITRVSVRKDNIGDYIAPIVENYINFNYLGDDDIDVISKFNYEEYSNIISNIDFSNYSIFYRKKK